MSAVVKPQKGAGKRPARLGVRTAGVQVTDYRMTAFPVAWDDNVLRLSTTARDHPSQSRWAVGSLASVCTGCSGVWVGHGGECTVWLVPPGTASGLHVCGQDVRLVSSGCPRYLYDTCAIGFSAVLFGLKVREPNTVHHVLSG